MSKYGGLAEYVLAKKQQPEERAAAQEARHEGTSLKTKAKDSNNFTEGGHGGQQRHEGQDWKHEQEEQAHAKASETWAPW